MSLYISVISSVFVLNFLGFLLAYFYETDKLTDLMYSLSFVCALFILMIFFSDFSFVQLAVAFVVFLWAIRLGAFLFSRIHKMGKDDRFDEMRKSFFRFGGFWFLQAISVCILLIPVMIIFSKPSEDLGLFQMIGIVISLIGITIEAIADYQKDQFKQQNPGKLYVGGLFRYVRYPNYSGEIMVWIGIWLIGIGYYDSVEWISIISPIWIFTLLGYISGIPLIEQKRLTRYKENQNYTNYLKKTPRLIPFLY